MKETSRWGWPSLDQYDTPLRAKILYGLSHLPTSRLTVTFLAKIPGNPIRVMES